MISKELIPYVPLVAAGLTVAGLTLVAWLNNRWAERTRKLDLYKVVYPEKVKAAQPIVSLAAALWNKTCQYDNQKRLQAPEVVKELRADADQLYAMSISNEWILGAHICDLSRMLAVCIRKVAPVEPRPGGPASWSPSDSNNIVVVYHQTYQKLVAELRGNLHIEPLENLLPTDRRRIPAERVSLATQYVQNGPADQASQPDEPD